MIQQRPSFYLQKERPWEMISEYNTVNYQFIEDVSS